MKRILLIIFLAIALCGCLTSRPQHIAEFRKLSKVQQLEGVYKNVGDVGKGEYPVYLSALIWPSGKEVDFRAVEKIEVRTVNDTTIVVKAHSKETVLREKAFIEGKDFEIDGGIIRLKRKFGVAGFKGGEPMLGPYYESAELGIDQEGHGKYRTDFAIAGLVFMVVPIALGVNQEVRFEKIGP